MPSGVERAFVSSPIASGRLGIQAVPFQFLFTGEDNLRVSVCAFKPGLQLFLVGRFLEQGDTKPRAFSQTITPLAAGNTETFVLPMGVGVLLNLVVRSNTPLMQPGQCYVRLDVQRGDGGAAIVLGTLMAGYVLSQMGRAWPGSALESPQEGPGWIHYLQSSPPAAGADPQFLSSVPSRYRLITIDGSLQTSGVAGVRTIYLAAVLDGIVIMRTAAPLTVGPAASVTFNWGAGVGFVPASATLISIGSLPTDLYLDTATGLIQVFTFTSGIDAGDQWTPLTLFVEDWRSPT